MAICLHAPPGVVLFVGAAVGMMHATKETWILFAAAGVAAAGLTWGWMRIRGGGVEGREQRSVPLPFARTLLHILAGVPVACFVATAFYSLFGKNLSGPWDSIKAYANYFRRGSEQGEHSEPWYYYLQILFAYRPQRAFFWSEGFIAAPRRWRRLLAVRGPAAPIGVPCAGRLPDSLHAAIDGSL